MRGIEPIIAYPCIATIPMALERGSDSRIRWVTPSGRTMGDVVHLLTNPPATDLSHLLGELLSDPNAEKSERVMKAMLQMKKIDIGALKRAYEGQRQ